MDRYHCWAVARHADVTVAVKEPGRYSSGSGVCLNDLMNTTMAGSSVLQTDPPQHTEFRRVLGRRLTPRALAGNSDGFLQRARALVDELLTRSTFDVVADFAKAFPISVVPDLLGCPADGRDHLLRWASAAFQATGPMNARTEAALPDLQEFLAYTTDLAAHQRLSPGGWGDQMLTEARNGEIDESALPLLLVDYLGPSIDTTINSLSTAILIRQSSGAMANGARGSELDRKHRRRSGAL
jgi:cytochrome P450